MVVATHLEPAASILVVDDEESFLDPLELALRREGFDVYLARDGQEALEQFDAVGPDVILLDVMLPRLSGIDVCRALRKHSTVPIIMVSAKGEEIDAVIGLEVGADDYVAKPYRLRELIARIRAVLRRRPLGGAEGDGSELTVGNLSVDTQRHEVRVGEQLVDLPLKEFDLLTVLISNAGRVVTRQQLIDQVWGYDYVGSTKTLDVHIKRLRAKIETDPAEPERIVTIRGLGYKLALG